MKKAATTTNGKRCIIPGCGRAIHGKSLCRIHYDSRRYRLTTRGDAGAEAAAERERRVDAALRYGVDFFADEAEHRAAWQARREQMLEAYLTPPFLPGRRPAAWWQFEAGRPEYLVEIDYGDDLAKVVREDHKREVEKIRWLAANGHLTEAEIDQLKADAAEARPRIGTDSEHEEAGSSRFGGDKLRVELGQVVDRATRPRRQRRRARAGGGTRG